MVASLPSSSLFEKYTIDSTYTIRRTNSDGSITIIDDPQEKEKMLDGDFFRGSMSLSLDARHVSLIHKIIYVFQKIHAWLTGRHVDNEQASACHGMVILGKGIAGKKKAHPFLVAHAFVKGIQTSNNDYNQTDEATGLLIYRPVDGRVREIYKHMAEQTAFVDNVKQRTALSPKERHQNSPWKMALSFFHNKKHSACLQHGPIRQGIKKKIASLVADTLLGSQPRDAKGHLQSFFCAPYALSLLQAALFMKEIDTVEEEMKKQFLQDREGHLLSRKKLIDRIVFSFEKEDKDNGVASKFWKLFSTQKLVRLDAEYMMPCYAIKYLNKLSYHVSST